MSLFSTLLAIPAAVAFISAILFVIFGQITVRKLRRIPETKQALGIELLSGWDVINVATVLALPKGYARKIRMRPKTGLLHANIDLLYEHTTVFDRVLARTFYWSWMSSAFALIILMVLDWVWGFD